MDPALIVTVITRIAPSLYKRAMKAFHDAAMLPSLEDAKTMTEYLNQFNRRRCFNPQYQADDEDVDAVIKSVDKMLDRSHDYTARLHGYARGQVMVEAITMACQKFLDKWARYEGYFGPTFDGKPSGDKGDVLRGVRVNAFFNAFFEDLTELRRSSGILRAGIADLVAQGAPSWGGWVVENVGSALAAETLKALTPRSTASPT